MYSNINTNAPLKVVDLIWYKPNGSYESIAVTTEFKSLLNLGAKAISSYFNLQMLKFKASLEELGQQQCHLSFSSHHGVSYKEFKKDWKQPHDSFLTKLTRKYNTLENYGRNNGEDLGGDAGYSSSSNSSSIFGEDEGESKLDEISLTIKSRSGKDEEDGGAGSGMITDQTSSSSLTLSCDGLILFDSWLVESITIPLSNYLFKTWRSCKGNIKLMKLFTCLVEKKKALESTIEDMKFLNKIILESEKKVSDVIESAKYYAMEACFFQNNVKRTCFYHNMTKQKTKHLVYLKESLDRLYQYSTVLQDQLGTCELNMGQFDPRFLSCDTEVRILDFLTNNAMDEIKKQASNIIQEHHSTICTDSSVVVVSGMITPCDENSSSNGGNGDEVSPPINAVNATNLLDRTERVFKNARKFDIYKEVRGWWVEYLGNCDHK